MNHNIETRSEATFTDILIVGAGFGGLGMGIQLKRRGEDAFVILERANDVGGTWRDNHYPGVACDVPSHLYSFSFRANPNWSQVFSPGSEIQQYLRDCAREEGLLPHMGRDDEDIDPDRAAEALVQRVQEERRLMYVGITRAQRSLHLSWCKKRRRAREFVVREPSRFIGEMGLGDSVQTGADAQAISPKARLDMLKSLLNKSA